MLLQKTITYFWIHINILYVGHCDEKIIVMIKKN